MAIEISAQAVKELRDKTSAGMMDCKKALQDSNGDMTKAMETLRQKGLASANKKTSRIATEGLVESYIHMGGKLGVIVEVNCETDFVARRPEFQELAKNIAMQIAASPSVEYINLQSIPLDTINKEKEIESSKEDLAKKPAEIKEKIVEGNIDVQAVSKGLDMAYKLKGSYEEDKQKSINILMPILVKFLNIKDEGETKGDNNGNRLCQCKIGWVAGNGT